MHNCKCIVVTVLVFNCLLVAVSHGKSIDRCEFVHELKRLRPQIDFSELNAWTCIAQYQSNFNVSLRNSDATGANYHGIFQISDIYWCSSISGIDRLCEIRCDQLHDAYLKDDFECAATIYAEHFRIHGNGFSAWPIYEQHCSDGRDIIKDCLSNSDKRIVHVGSNKPIQMKDKSKSIAEKKTHKIYERCELARELHSVHNIPRDHVATWVCIAKYESSYNTSAVGHQNADGSLDHGLFQISDIYWCSPPGKGWVCGLSCAKLENSDISDDVVCMQKIYDEHQRLSGNGYNAWSVYKPHCKHNVEQFVAGCFENDEINEVILPIHKPAIFAPPIPGTIALKKKSFSGSKVYNRCDLARDLRYKYNMPKDQIHTWVCIAQSLSGLNTAFQAPKNADGSSSHGLFQISDKFWCDVNGIGNGCNVNCNDLKDGDIGDDIECVRKIYSEHGRLFGDGFQAWSPYENHCKWERAESLKDCFENEIFPNFASKPINSTSAPNKPSTVLAKKGKIYERCELAKELRTVHNIPLDQIHTWVCIANHESRFDTTAIGRLNADGSLDHGLFQISDIYWCSNEGAGKGCNAACTDFRNSDISDDVRCIQQIHDEHQRLFGNGFHAWAVYEPHCRHQTSQYISDCFPNEIDLNVGPAAATTTTTKPVVSIVSNAIGDQGRAFERCELAKELRYRHNVSQDKIADWVCIALYSSNLATSAKGQNSHGLFQINNEYWCSNTGVKGKKCNVKCSQFEDSDITDDYQCAQLIYDTHTELYGNGFSAWNVYEPYCSGRSSQLIDGCFDDIAINKIVSITESYRPTQSHNSIADSDKKGKVYDRCELARELRYKHNLPLEQIHTWICIVQRESNFDTSAIGRLNADGSLDHGLFQISDIYWCSNSGAGKACGVPCTSFRNADITDDVQCIKRIFDEHQRLFSNGFNAWTTYEPYCKQTTSSFTDDCFANVEHKQTIENVTRKTTPSTFAPFTTTLNQLPNTVTTKLTPLNQIKYSTFAPLSVFTSTTSNTKYPTTATTDKSVTYFSPTTATKQPVLVNLSQFGPTLSIAPTKPTYAPFTWLSTKTTTTLSPNSIVPTATKCTTKQSKPYTLTYAGLPANFFIPTTPKTTFVSKPSIFGFSTVSPSPTTSTKSIISSTHKINVFDLYLGRLTTKQPATASPFLTIPSTYPVAPLPSSTPRINLYDLYLGRLTTKKPERYVFPTFASLPKRQVQLPNPYIVRTSTAPVTQFVNTYSFPDNFHTKSTVKPSAEQVQTLFEAQASKFAQSLGIPNATAYSQLTGVATSPQPRVWRYSFSGTKAPALPMI